MSARVINWFKYASPQTFYPLAGKLIPWFWALAAVFGVAGLTIGFLLAPIDEQQGEGYRIIFLHVPASWLSMFIYLVMAFWAGIGLAFNMRLSGMMASALAPQPLALIVLGKVIAHWLVAGLPLVLLAPVLGIQFDLANDALAVLTLSLLIGTPALSGIGAIGAALTLGVRGGGVLLSLLVLPLYIPVLIFGAGAVDATVSGLGAQAHLSLLGALALGGVFFAPWPTAAALRIALE